MKLKKLFEANRYFLSELIENHKLLFVLQIIVIFLSAINTVGSSYIPKLFLDMVQIGANFNIAIVFIFIYSVFVVFRGMINNIVGIYQRRCYNLARFKTKYYTDMHYQKFNDAFFDNPDNFNITKRALSYANSGGEHFINYLFSLLSNFISMISLIIILTPFDWWISVFLIGMMFYRIIIEYIQSKKEFQFKNERTLCDRKMGYFSRLPNEKGVLYDIRVNGVFNFFHDKFENLFMENIRSHVKHEKKMLLFKFLLQIPYIVQNLILYSYIGYYLYIGELSAGDFGMFFAATSNFNLMLQNIKNSFTQLAPMTFDAENYITFMETSPEYLLSNGRQTVSAIKTIEFDNVSFKYSGKDYFVLKNVSFIISCGEKIQIVGINGAGKTTLLKLILGFYRPTYGQIRVNGYSLETIDLKDYWKQIGVLFQQYNIYSMSAIENITFNAYEENEAGVEKILNEFDLLKRLESEPLGLRTELSKSFSEIGTDLSGGEKQKIALSRAIFKNGNVLILDEPTSALDGISEEQVFKTINSIHRTVLCVFHKINHLYKPDKILVLDKNTCVGFGEHEKLLSECQLYRKIYESQNKQVVRNHV